MEGIHIARTSGSLEAPPSLCVTRRHPLPQLFYVTPTDG